MPNLISSEDLSEGYLINDDYKKMTFVKVPDVSKIEIDSGKVITSASKNGYLYYRLENEDGFELSLVRLKKEVINNKEFYSVDKSRSFIKGKGYAIPLYEYSFCYLELPVISDSMQTKPGSSNLWKKFKERQIISSYEIRVFNTETDHTNVFTNRNYNDYDVWGWDPDFIQMVKDDPDFLDEALKYKNINTELYRFINSNINKIRDRKKIRLIGKIKNCS